MINLLKKNNYLAGVNSADVAIAADNTYVPVIHNWYKIDGYRAKENESDTKDAVKRAAFGWIRGAGSNCSAFVMDRVAGKTTVLTELVETTI